MGKLNRPDGTAWDSQAAAIAMNDVLVFYSDDPLRNVGAIEVHLRKAYADGLTDGAAAVISATHADRMKLELDQYLAAAMLCAHDVASYLPPETIGGKPRLGLICSDTFGYAVADCEAVALSEAPKFLKLWDTEGWPGIVRWIATKRGTQPMLEVQATMAGTDPVYRLIERERERQDAKWGVQNHAPLSWQAILAEECGEVAKAVLEDDHAGYLKELVHAAAVCVAAVQCAARGETDPSPPSITLQYFRRQAGEMAKAHVDAP